MRYILFSTLCAALLVGCSKPESAPVSSEKSITIWWAEWAPSKGLREPSE